MPVPKRPIFHAALRDQPGTDSSHVRPRPRGRRAPTTALMTPTTCWPPYRTSCPSVPVYSMNWLYCPHCGEITSEGLCNHKKEWQKFSGTVIRSIVQDGVKPPRLIYRPEVFDVMMECGEKYGFGSPFVTDEYLEKRIPVFEIPPMK